mmetsp:Transcript_24819/g.27624  ORF Transcript_24819/g.27624 Transcript_24819/m.27624 type:complete len:271 (-) Transcript_24819:30-842(-)
MELVSKAKDALTDQKDEEEIIKQIKALHEVKATVEILKATAIGAVIGGLCQHDSETVVAACKELQQKWKKDLGSSTPSKKRKAGDITNPKPEKKIKKNVKPLTLDDVKTGVTKRNKVIQMLSKALPMDTENAILHPLAVARDIEKELIKLYNEPSNKQYTQKFRSLYSNIKKNQELQSSLLDGTLSPEQICSYGASELATSSQKEHRAKKSAYDLEARQVGNKVDVVDGFFTCGKCKSTKTSYYQLQTRSADEPMTTFITCANCKNRWRQ